MGGEGFQESSVVRDEAGKFSEGGGGGAAAPTAKDWAKGGRAKKEPKASKDPRAEGDRPKASAEKFDATKAGPMLGEGANRKVHDAGPTEVIKVAKNAGAKKENRAEAEASGMHPLLAKVTEHGPGHEWIRQEKLSNVSLADMAKHFGVSAADQKKTYEVQIKDPWGLPQTVTGKDWLFAAIHSVENGGATAAPKSAGKLVEALKGLKAAVPKIELADMAYPNQWGRSAGGEVKVADYGFVGGKK